MNIQTTALFLFSIGSIHAAEQDSDNRSVVSVDDMVFVSPRQNALSIFGNALENLEIEIRRTLTEQGAMIEEAISKPEHAGTVIAATSFGLVVPGGFPDLGVYDDEEPVMHEPSLGCIYI